MKINERLRKIRKSKGITQTFIAQKMGKTPAWYSNVERGYRRLLAEDAKRIAEILGVDIREIFEEWRIDQGRARREIASIAGDIEILNRKIAEAIEFKERDKLRNKMSDLLDNISVSVFEKKQGIKQYSYSTAK